ncbi:MAG: hypothetical protein IIA55_06645, partial [Gemmatimonadetes bacterium]|nr:hypothetical protein [Gemmatimonadota bacterium]
MSTGRLGVIALGIRIGGAFRLIILAGSFRLIVLTAGFVGAAFVFLSRFGLAARVISVVIVGGLFSTGRYENEADHVGLIREDQFQFTTHCLLFAPQIDPRPIFHADVFF